jgi:glycine C-acetyltransferase
LPSFLVEYSFKRFQSNREKQRRRLVKNTEQLAKGLKQSGYEINSATQIIPIIIGNEKKAMEFGKFLFDNGVFAQPIRYPTVPKDQARLRISVTAWLSDTDIEKTLEIFDKARGKFL